MKKETGRIEAFSDGVFAIAITLLVLDLGVPAPGRFAETLLADWTSYVAYLAAFLTLASIWLMRPSSVSPPVATTTPVARPDTTRVPENAMFSRSPTVAAAGTGPVVLLAGTDSPVSIDC